MRSVGRTAEDRLQQLGRRSRDDGLLERTGRAKALSGADPQKAGAKARARGRWRNRLTKSTSPSARDCESAGCFWAWVRAIALSQAINDRSPSGALGRRRELSKNSTFYQINNALRLMIKEEGSVEVYDFEVLRGEEVIAAQRSVPLCSPRARGRGSSSWRRASTIPGAKSA